MRLRRGQLLLDGRTALAQFLQLQLQTVHLDDRAIEVTAHFRGLRLMLLQMQLQFVDALLDFFFRQRVEIHRPRRQLLAGEPRRACRPIDELLGTADSLAREEPITLSPAPVPRKNWHRDSPAAMRAVEYAAPSRSPQLAPQWGQLKTISRSLTATTESGATWVTNSSDSSMT
jgi:hypothetical protein